MPAPTEPVISPFLPSSQAQYAWDSTSLGYLKTCPRKYYLTMIEGWRKKDESVHLIFGGIFASAMEYYHKQRATGVEYEDAVEATVRHVYELIWKHKWNPENSPKKNPTTLMRTVIWYLTEYKDDVAKTVILANGQPAVELSFSFESGYQIGGKDVLLSGHLDRVVDFGGLRYVQDQKTTGGALGAYFFSGFNPDNQMTLYTLASKVVWNMPVQGVMIDAAKVIVGASEFERGITMRSNAQLEEWLTDFGMWVATAERYAEREHWPMNEASCGNYGGCVFRGICSKDPTVREMFLETDFEKRYWNPLEVR